jgi:septum site-determining protein MinD
MAQSWMIASGKGGVGKSTLCGCLAICLAKKGERVAVIDTDIGLRNMDAVLGLENNIVYDICDVADKECTLLEALVRHPAFDNLSLLPAAQFRKVKALNRESLAKIVRKLKKSFSYVLIDCPAGIDRGLSNSLNAADEVILVTTPDDMTIRDVEQTANFLMKKHQPRPYLIVNRLIPQLIKAGEMLTAPSIASLLDLQLLGAIPYDEEIYRAALTHRLPLESNSVAAKALERIADRMRGKESPIPPMGIEKKGFLAKIFQKKEELSYVKREQTL